jgi:hypothetical protein
MKKRTPPRSLTDIPGVGKSIAEDLRNIGIHRVEDLKGMDPQRLFELSNVHAGLVQDRCLLYVFRCAVYFAETPEEIQEPEKLKWWNWKEGINTDKRTKTKKQ